MTVRAPRLRRSVLYVPASNPRAMAKSWTLGADAVVFDLEDAVAPAAKPTAREALVAELARERPPGLEVVIRVNAVGTDDLVADLQAVQRARPDAILVPKVGDGTDLRVLADAAARQGLATDLAVWAMVETAAGLARLDSIVATGLSLRPRLECLVVGTNDIAKETGVFPGERRAYLMPWLMNVVLVARHRGVAVLDGVWNDFKDTEGFEAEALQASRMAFDGKTLIHPSQVEPANRLFSPSAEAIEDARRIVALFSDPAHAAANVVNMDGRMVERLHYEQARRLLERLERSTGGDVSSRP
ncbi:MAG TPA: CoA ester lyase [Burkholderiaceae bacterium]|nr:CoA ester lyase [Burkholderiaceae bacterium]